MTNIVVALVAFIVFALGYRQLAAQAAPLAGDAAEGASTGTAAAPFPRGSLIRCLAFLALLLFLTVYSALGLVQDDFASFTVLAFVLVACALLQLRIPELVGKAAGALPRALAWVRPAAVVALVSALALLALEIPSNHDVYLVAPHCLALEYALIVLFACTVWFLCQRRGAGLVVPVVLLLVVGLAQYFVITFKNQPIMPSDILAIQTAAAVSKGYVYELSAYVLYAIALAAVACAVAPFASPAQAAKATEPGDAAKACSPAPKRRRWAGVAVNLVCTAVLGFGLYWGVARVDYIQTLHIDVDAWQPLRSYYSQGFLPTFIVNLQSIQPKEPVGYSDEFAGQILADYVERYDEGAGASEQRAAASEQFASEKPCVVAIMNESFSDLSIFDGLGVGYEGPQGLKGINDALARGKFYVSAYGGGTCNTEFEFLTGASFGYLGAGVYPYQLYNLSGAESLARDFAAQGYTSSAMHPNAASNWNRENVYKSLGFENFYSIEDFEGAETYRGMVSDRATYDKILDLLRGSDDPQFIFDVTMQNHSGYLTGELPADKQHEYVDYSVSDDESMPETNEYLSLVEESDQALVEFLGELQELDRPVVVVFFGDHQPYFTGDYNDALMTGDEEIDHTQRLWQTEYVVWANYDVAGADQTSPEDDISANFLGAKTLELIGADLTDYKKAQLAIRELMPAVNLIGYQGADRDWYWHGQASDYVAGFYDLAHLQYRMLFRNGEGNLYDVERADATNDVDPTAIKPTE